MMAFSPLASGAASSADDIYRFFSNFMRSRGVIHTVWSVANIELAYTASAFKWANQMTPMPMRCVLCAMNLISSKKNYPCLHAVISLHQCTKLLYERWFPLRATLKAATAADIDLFPGLFWELILLWELIRLAYSISWTPDDIHDSPGPTVC